MKITAKLAYSQLKINRSRTRWTLIAIALSTALTTAVCSFVASGNTMLIELLGEDYGAYGESYRALLLIPAVIFGLLIIAMSVTVISNVFRISVQERVMQFGVLKCTGATEKQIMDTVMYESIWLCVIGIPIGIGLGLVLAFGGIHVANYFFDDLNDLAHVMINEIDFSIHFVFSWQAILLSVILSFITVLYSAWRPAHKAAKVSAIACIRGMGGNKTDHKQLRENKLVKKLFGFEGTLADKNLKRNHRNFRATVISLSVGVILFVSLGGLGMQASAIEDFLYPDTDQAVISEYISNYTREVNQKTGKKETKYSNPIDRECGELVKEKLEQFNSISIFGMGNDMDTYDTILSNDLVSAKMQAAYEEDKLQDYEFPVEIIVVDRDTYAKLCEKANVPIGSTILLNHYRYNDFGHEVNLEPYSSSIKEMELLKADGSNINVPIQGILTQEQIPKELLYPNTNPVRLVVENAMVRGFSWQCVPEDIKGFIEYSNQVMEEEFPSEPGSSYMKNGFNTRVYRMDDYMKVMNIAIALVAVFMYSFVGLLVLIGLTNVISTLSINVMMRSREFAVLKSVGMTPEGLRQMLNFESILCSIKALAYGIPIGVVVTLLINLPIRSMFLIAYKVPWISLLLCVFVVFFITWGTTRYATHKLENQNIIESIRSEIV
ncbi:ABC transporter permease [Lachnospiraceae bacterium LCP25S3_G4]